MARPNDIYQMAYEDGGMTLDELLSQLEPVYQAPAYVVPEPVYYQPEPVYQPEVQASAPQTIQEVINQIAPQLPPSVVNQLISQQIAQEDTPVEALQPVRATQPIQPTQVQETQPTKPSASVIDSLTKQILGQGTSDKWKGGVSAEVAAKDMARIMANAGITDIKQFGVRQEVIPASSGEWGETPEQIVNKYINKDTGKELENTYAERQTGNAFGGTFQGKGNTGYRVDFAPDGTPVFYTTQSSSNDLFNILAQNPILNAAATYFAFQAGGPVGVAALNAAQGKSFEDVAKATLLSYAGSQIAPEITKLLPTPDVPIDFAGGTPEQINDALQNQFVKDLKAAGVTNVSEFINNVGGNAALVSQPTEPVITPIPEPTPTVSPVENVQVTAPTQPTPTVAPTIAEVINSIVNQQPIPTQVPPVENVQVTAPAQPTTPTVTELINAIAQTPVQQPIQQAPSPVEVTAPKEQVSPEIINAVNAQLASNVTPTQLQPVEVTAPKVEAPKTVEQVIASIAPELVVTEQAPKQAEQPVLPIINPAITPSVPELTTIAQRPSTITEETTNPPLIVPTPIDTTLPKVEKKWTAGELADLARLGLLATTVFGATTQDKGPTGFDIVPVPAEWKSSVYPKDVSGVSQTQLPALDFGNRNLLIGTQWEKFLDPNYGKVPTPVQFNQPSNMSYDRLMGILGTGRDTLPSQALSINDVISGIQNQYGQAPKGSMG